MRLAARLAALERRVRFAGAGRCTRCGGCEPTEALLAHYAGETLTPCRCRPSKVVGYLDWVTEWERAG